MDIRRPNFVVQLLGPNRVGVENATVTVESGGRTFRLTCETSKGFYTADEVIPKGECTVTVHKKPFETESRKIRIGAVNDPEVFMLRKEGTPFYFRGRVKVPFEPDTDHIALMVRECSTLSGGKQRKRLAAKERTAIARKLAKKYKLKMDEAHSSFHEQGIFICSFPAKTSKKRMQEICDGLEHEETNTGLPIIRVSETSAAFLTNEVMAKFEDHVEPDEVAEIAGALGLRVKRQMRALGNLYHFTTGKAPTYDLLDTIQALAERDDVEFAEPNLAATVEEDAITPTDYLFPEQWDHQIINTPDAWQFLRNINVNRTFGSPNIIIGVVDSGVDPNHPDFNGTVSDGTSKIYQAFDFANMVPNNNSLTSGHGTACASAAASTANNVSAVAGSNEGVSGVAGNCRVLAIKRSGVESDYADFYLWAGGFDPDSDDEDFPAQISPGADVISSSIGLGSAIGSPTSGTMAAVFDKLTDDGRDGKGVALFFSAANNSNDNDTAFDRPWGMYSRCFSIAASTLQNDGLTEDQAGYSNFSSQTEFCAPSHDAYMGGAPLHNPPANFGAFTATPTSGPEGHGTVGRPTTQTTLSAAAAAGTNTISVASTAGLAAGQAIMIGVPGGGATEAHMINNVNAGTSQITLNRNLFNAQPNGAAVSATTWDYRSNFGGTSHATPLCAGTAALMLSANPQLTWVQLRDLLRATAVKINPGENNAAGRWQDVNGNMSNSAAYDGNPFFSEFYGYGRIDTASAVREAGWDIDLVTTALDFNDVPEGDTVSRAVRFNVRSLWPTNFSLTPPGGPFAALSTTEALGSSPDSSIVREVYFWVTYTGTNEGDTITPADGFTVTVDNPETEQQWVIPVTANVIAKETAAIMLCLDQSGSMDFPSGIGASKRIDILRFSANIMIDVLHENNGLGIVAFDHDPHDVLPFTGPVGPPISPSNPFNQDRTDMKAAINNFVPNPAGATAIGDGVERATDRLTPVTDYDSKSIVVFTDGKETASKRINEVTGLINDRVFAVGLGKASAIEPAALNELTNSNEGYMLLADDLGMDSIFKLAKYFLQIQAAVNNEDVVVDPDGTLQPGQLHEIPFVVNEGDITLDVIVMVPHPSSVDFALRTPNGQIIQPSDDGTVPGVTYGYGDNVVFYRLNLPVPLGIPEREGTWTALLSMGKKWAHGRNLGMTALATVDSSVAASGDDASSSTFGRVPYSLLVHSYSNLRMKTHVTQTHYEPGALIKVGCALTQYGVPLDQKCTVRAVLTDPTDQDRTIELTHSGNGVYNAIVEADRPGAYQFRVMAQGLSLRGRSFTREQVRSASVWRGGNQPPQGPGEDGPSVREEICGLIRCLLNDRVVSWEMRKRMREKGVDLEAIIDCLKAWCSGRSAARSSPAALGRIKADYVKLLKTYNDVLKDM